MVDSLSFFLFHPVFHNWCNKDHGMYYPVCGMVHIKEPLLLIGKSSRCSGGSRFPHSLFEWSFTICPLNSLKINCANNKREREMFYLTTHSTHFIYGYMASDIWLKTILIVRKETRCYHIDYCYRYTSYSFLLAARVLLYAPSHRQDNTYHGLCYTSHGALAGTRNSSIGSPFGIDPTTHPTMNEPSATATPVNKLMQRTPVV